MTARPASKPESTLHRATVLRRRTLFIRDLAVAAQIGVWTHEHGRTQPLRLSLELDVDPAPIADRLSEAVCYQQVVDGIHAVLAAGHVALVETLAERIGAMALAFPGVARVRITIDKLEAIAGAACAGVTLTLERTGAADGA